MAGRPKGLPKTGGKQKGTPNKATIEFKEAVTNLLNYATPHMVEWMQRIAIDDPHKALEHVHKFAQFSHPLLSRQALTGADDKAIYHHVTMTPEIIAAEKAAIDARYGILPKSPDKT